MHDSRLQPRASSETDDPTVTLRSCASGTGDWRWASLQFEVTGREQNGSSRVRRRIHGLLSSRQPGGIYPSIAAPSSGCEQAASSVASTRTESAARLPRLIDFDLTDGSDEEIR